ncbi:MAG TPA: 50S ribosomal protein L3 [Candidatus Cloacimonetes bacterium]|nr:50S ribosomal protein L3 [Candidatus Cloacimonadota bacterium]HEX37875.1 50S ribosomal protein L3 [Candidatus Cloacimonadota bacterium]
MLGIIGKKIGMTRLFTENGDSVPVTVIEAGPCKVVQQKTMEKDNYSALQLGFDEVSETKLNKPERGHFAKRNIAAYKVLREFRIDEDLMKEYPQGSEIKVNIFNPGAKVHVTGISKGKGFAGVMKRHNFHGKNMTHGTHEIFRGTGSVGMCATPSRIHRGKKMPGQYGYDKVTVRNLVIYKIDEDRNIIMVKGAIPGHRNSIVLIQKTK